MMTTRLWQIGDCGSLPPMILDLLAENAPLGADMAPTEENVAILLALGMQWASRGDPTLVACDSSGQVIGFTLWGAFDNMAGVLLTKRTCNGVGTYVVPAWRNQGVASELRRAAANCARAKGYERVLGATFHEAALRSTLRVGFKVIGQVTEWQL